jgi:DNA end-binding protein Ku
MAKSIWTGALSVSLIGVPVKLGSSSKDSKLGLRMVRKTDGAPIRFQYVSETDRQPVEWNDIARAYDTPDGSLVVLDKADFEKAYGEKNRTAEILMFTDAGNIPPMAVKSSYWVQPDKGGEKMYALLAESMRSTGKVAILTFAMRERVSVAVLRPHDGYLALESLEWDADLIRPDFPAPPQTATASEQEYAATLIESMTGKYDHSSQRDVSAEAVMAVIEAKISTSQTIPAPRSAKASPGAPQDLTEALKASVAAQKNNPGAPKPRARRKAAAHKAVV